jgi:hypothetical protein
VCAKTGVAQVGQYANTATVSGVVITPDNNVWQLLGSDTSYYLGRGGEVQFTKTTNGQNASRTPGIFLGIGEPVTWSYHITNTGHVALSSLRIVDDREGDILNCTPSLELVLAPGASVSCTKSGITQRGQYTNTATFVGASVSGPAHVVQASATNYYFASSSEMAKRIAPAMANAGDELTVTLVVTSHVPARSTTFHMVDQLPREFQLVDGSIVASIGSVAVDAATNALHWSHTSAAGVSARLTLIYRVRLTTACFAEVNSVAELFDASDPVPVGRVGATVRPANGSYCELFLPMTIAQVPPPDPMPSLVNGFFDAWPLGEGWTQLINGMPERLLYNRTETQPVDAMTAPNLAWLGGRPNQTNQLRQQQRILIPSQYETKLQFGYYIASREARCGNDWAEIRVGATAVPTPADLLLRLDLCSAANTNAWRNHPPISLNAFRGRSVTVEFFTSLNGSDNSNLYLDNLEICSDQQAPFCRYSLRSVLLDEDEITSSDLTDPNPIPLNRVDAFSPKPE